MFTADSLKWTKNVKRDEGRGIAYFEPGMEDSFNLNFSVSQKKAHEHLKEGDVILLFQRVDKLPGLRPETYLTHLVTPLDNEMIENRDNPDFPYEIRVGVIGRADPRSSNPIYSIPAFLNFYKPGWGKLCSIGLLNTDWTEDRVREKVWKYFRNNFNFNYEVKILEAKTLLPGITLDEYSALEGGEQEVIRRHIFRERNPDLVRRAKEAGLARGNGSISCECCDFNFTATYGPLGARFIECHHKYPIAEGGERITSLGDLALVCSNCHRMLHRRNENGAYLNIEELKKIVIAQRAALSVQ